MNTAQLIRLASVELDFMKRGEGFALEFGEKSKHKTKEPGKDSYKADKIISSSVSNKAVVKPVFGKVTLETQKKLSELRTRGIILHKALSYITSVDDVEKAVIKLKAEGVVNQNNEDELLNELLDILKIKEVREWFSGDYEVKPENEIILPGGEVYRPDRVLIKDNKAIVVDFKTGRERNEDVKQINDYGKVLSQMAYTDVKKYLFYVTDRKLVQA
jgi:hypothetical protein